MATAIALLVSGCRKDDPTPDMDGPPVSGLFVNLTGRVLAENGAFVPNAAIRVNGRTTTSDADGIFRLTGVPANEGRNYLRADKQGYYFGGRNFIVHEGGEYRVQVVLGSRIQIGSFQASAGGTVQTADGMIIQIPANGIESGYQGEVRVFAKYLDPTVASSIMQIPGLQAIDLSNEPMALESFGMGHIELESGSGGTLQLAEGTTAQLTMPVPSGLLSAASTIIPLWYFDTEQGIWKEEGSAQLQGNNYMGNVTHFSVWNCDRPAPPCTVRLTLTCGGIPFGNMPVVVRFSGTTGFVDTGVTSEEGKVNLGMPCGVPLDVFVLPPAGNGAEYSMGNWTPQNGSGMEHISFESLCGPHASVRGSAVTGAGLPVTNGYMYLRFDDFYTEPVFFNSQGEFTASFFDYTPQQLATGAQIIAWDLDNFLMVEGPIIPFNEQVNVLPEPIVIGAAASIGGRIYTGGFDQSNFYCLDASDGSVIWTFDSPGLAFDVSPVISNGLVYFTSLSGELFCLNAFDGTEIWSAFGYSESYAPFADNGVLYISSNYGIVKAIDGNTGSQVWQYNSGGSGMFSAPTIVGNTLYCGGNDATPGLLALNKNDGSLLWQWDAPDEVNTSPCVADGKVFFGCSNQKVYAVDASTGALQWEQTIDDATNLTGALTAGQGMVYAQALSKLVAMNTSNGNIVWEKDIYAQGGGGNPYLDGNRLFASNISGPVYCYDAATGATNYTVPGTGSGGEIATHFLVVENVLLMNRYAHPSALEARNALTGELIWSGAPQDDCTAPIVLVDDNGVAHYSTASGMQQ